MSVVNTLATPFLIAGLWSVSRATELTVTSSGEVHGYPWLPAWLAFGITIALFAYFVARIDERGVPLRWVHSSAVPYFSWQRRWGSSSSPLRFRASSGRSARSRRDKPSEPANWSRQARSRGATSCCPTACSSTSDGACSALAVFEDSYWGFVAGDEVLLIPLAWVTLYYLCAYLFWSNWLYLLGTQLVIVCGQSQRSRRGCSSSRWPSCFSLPCFETESAARRCVHRGAARPDHRDARGARRRGGFVGNPRRLRVPLSRTRSKARRGLPADDPLPCGRRRHSSRLGRCSSLPYRCARRLGVQLRGDDPRPSSHRRDRILPLRRRPSRSPRPSSPCCSSSPSWPFGVRLRRRLLVHGLVDGRDGGLHAPLLLQVPESCGFRPSGPVVRRRRPVALLRRLSGNHVRRSAARDAPPRLGRALVPAAPHAHAPPAGRPAVTAPEPLHGAVRAVPGHFRTVAGAEPEIAGIGYTRSGENDPGGAARPRGRAELAPGAGRHRLRLLERSGSLPLPARERPSTPYYHVSYAIRRRSRRISSTICGRAGRPRSCSRVPARAPGLQQPSPWDGIVNAVRHYDVSEYLLDHYVPVRDVGGFVVMAPPRPWRPSGPRPLLPPRACDWGYVPSFFTPAPAASATSVSLPFRRLEPMGASGRTEYTVDDPG